MRDAVVCLLPPWKLALDAGGKSPKTISSHLDSAKRLAAYLTTERLPLEPEGIRGFLVAERGAHHASLGSQALPQPARLLPLAADRG